MNFWVIQRLSGLLLMLFSIVLWPPILVSWWYADGASLPFLSSIAITAGLGLLLWLPVRKGKRELRLRDGFLVVVLFWTMLGIFGALPLWFAEEPTLSFINALFESISGLTATGATVIVGLDTLPKSILFYRQMLQWFGGMGIIVLAVAILPMLGVGGMQLYRAETPGPVKDKKLTPRINETARALWLIYLGLTFACTVGFWLAGMDLFDAVGHAFSTVSTGGFSTHDASLGYFQSHWVEFVCVIFMLLGGINFGLHFLAVRQKSLRPYWEDAELRAYLLLFGLTIIVVVVFLQIMRIDSDVYIAFWHGIFQVVSIGTTTGLTTASFYQWPGFLPVLLIFTSFVYGCSGSTTGGIKVIRFLLLLKQGLRELKRLVHPRAHINVKIGKHPLDERVSDAVWGFFSAYVAVFVIMLLLLMLTGLDQVTAFSAVAACLNNVGVGLGKVGSNFADISAFAKYVLCIAMLLGRLEIFTLLVLFIPDFWRA